MGLFGKQSERLPALIKRVRNGEFQPTELSILIDKILKHPEFKPQRNLWMMTHADRHIRQMAIDLVKQVDDPSMADALVIEMVGKPAGTRAEMARVIVDMASDRIHRLVGPSLHSKREEQRESAMDILSAVDHPDEYLGLLKTAIKDPSANIRRRTVEILKESILNPAVSFLFLEGLRDTDEGVRHQAIEALCASPTVDIVEPFFEIMCNEPPRIRSQMTRALARLADNSKSRLEERLIPMLADEKQELREAAVSLLRDLPNPAQVLRAYLIHSRGLASWLRDRAEETIRQVADRLLPHLVELMKDPDDDIRVAAMNLAATCGDEDVIPQAQEILTSKADWWVRSVAADVLSRFPTREVIAALVSQIHDSELRHSVVFALGRTKLPAALPHLFDTLKDRERGIRIATLEALKNFEKDEVSEAIAEMAENEIDDAVRDKATALLESFGKSCTPMINRINKQEAERAREARESAEIPELEMVNEELNEREKTKPEPPQLMSSRLKKPGSDLVRPR